MHFWQEDYCESCFTQERKERYKLFVKFLPFVSTDVALTFFFFKFIFIWLDIDQSFRMKSSVDIFLLCD